MISINVDMDKCQHYGQCVFEAPDIFKLNNNDKLEFVATADDNVSCTAFNIIRQVNLERCCPKIRHLERT